MVLHRSIYHLLSRPLGQEISVTKVVDFNVFDEVAVGDVHLSIDRVGRVGRLGTTCRRSGGLDRGNVDMLNALFRLELRVDSRGRGSYESISHSFYSQSEEQPVPAAAAASTGDFFGSVAWSLGRGLRSLADSERLPGGDLERRSNLEALRGSGSVWSNRERLAERRSVSSIATSVMQ